MSHTFTSPRYIEKFCLFSIQGSHLAINAFASYKLSCYRRLAGYQATLKSVPYKLAVGYAACIRMKSGMTWACLWLRLLTLLVWNISDGLTSFWTYELWIFSIFFLPVFHLIGCQRRHSDFKGSKQCASQQRQSQRFCPVRQRRFGHFTRINSQLTDYWTGYTGK